MATTKVLQPTTAPAIRWTGDCPYCEAEIVMSVELGNFRESTPRFSIECPNCMGNLDMVRHAQEKK